MILKLDVRNALNCLSFLYNLSPSVRYLTKHVKWVVSTPMFCQKDNKFIGFMNFDGIDDIDHSIFEDGKFNSLCADFSIQMAYMLEQHGII